MHGSQMIYATALILLAQPPGVAPAPRYTCDPALTRLFTPPRPLVGRYEVCTTEAPLDGDAEALEALDAFGSAGAYKRAALARLYGGTRVRVARSWSSTPGAFTSVTKLSPYPDAALTRLQPGTLEIRWVLQR